MIRLIGLLLLAIALVGCGQSKTWAGLSESQARSEAEQAARENAHESLPKAWEAQRTRNPFGRKAWKVIVQGDDCYQIYLWTVQTTDTYLRWYFTDCP